MVSALAGLEPDGMIVRWKRVRQRELQIVLPSGIDHVVVVKLQRAILLRDFDERIAASVRIAPGDAPFDAVDQACRRASRELRLDRLGCEISGESPACPCGWGRCSSCLPFRYHLRDSLVR